MITAPAPQKAEKPRLRDLFDRWMVAEHYSPRTRTTYIHWVLHFVIHSGKRDPKSLGTDEVRAFLSHLANDRNVTWKTQRQALCASLPSASRVRWM
jgi:hypothetical protein